MARASGILMVLVLVTGSLLRGQEPSPPPAPDTGQTVPESVPASGPAGDTTPAPDKQETGARAGATDAAPAPDGQAAADVKSSLPQEHIIYLPFENLREVFEKQDSSVVLPYAQFLEMWNRLKQPEPSSAPLPVHAVISRAQYVGSVEGERVLLEVSLDVEALTADWARIPVTFGDAAIGSAQTPDGAVLLRGVGDGQYELLVKGQGQHQVKLSLVIGVKSATEGRSISVQCPPVGVSNLELQIPEKDLAVQVTPRRVLELRDDIPDTTRVIATLGSTNQFTVSWQPKSGGTNQAAGLASVTDTIAVDVGDGVVHTHAVFDYEILRGSLPELIVEVPSDQRLLDVQVPGLRDWRSEMVDDRQRVTVRLHAPAAEKTRLELHLETAIATEAFQVGHMRAVDAARDGHLSRAECGRCGAGIRLARVHCPRRRRRRPRGAAETAKHLLQVLHTGSQVDGGRIPTDTSDHRGQPHLDFARQDTADHPGGIPLPGFAIGCVFVGLSPSHGFSSG